MKREKNTGDRGNVLSPCFSVDTEKTNRKKPEWELLAPAGSLEIFRAVIHAGADAVYVGGDRFGARAFADNFSREELLYAIDYAHLWGRRVYLTVNTLFKEKELENELYDYLLPFYERGLDAVLVQDLGALAFIRQKFPDLPVHTSTQMTVTGIRGVEFMQKLGAKRVVMSREVSLREIKRIREKTGMELEVFVHGALCYSYSGQCLFSSLLGGRSGNRGRCAQPCRLSYTPLGAAKGRGTKQKAIFSLKDMRGITDLWALRKAGVYSLKIEGRMKQADYAAGTVSVYRKYMDEILRNGFAGQPEIAPEDLQVLSDLGSRGFTDRYYYDHNGRNMVTPDRSSYEKNNEKLSQMITGAFVAAKPALPVQAKVVIRQDQPAVMKVCFFSADGEQFCGQSTGDPADSAQKAPVRKEDLTGRLKKTGDTPFSIQKLTLTLQDNSFYPNGALNRLRREALDDLKEHILQPWKRMAPPKAEAESCAEAKDKPDGTPMPPALSLMVTGNAQLEAVLAYHTPLIRRMRELTGQDARIRIIAASDLFSPADYAAELEQTAQKLHEAGFGLVLALPHIYREVSADFFQSQKESLQKAAIDSVLVRNYEELMEATELFPGKVMIADHHLYTWNTRAKKTFFAQGITEDTVPLELNRGEIISRDNCASEMVIYGRYPLMISAQCVQKNTAGCMKSGAKGQRGGFLYLRDRYHKEFPVRNCCDHCYNIICNSLPTCLFHRIGELYETAGIKSFRFEFTTETQKQTAAVLEAFCRGEEKLSVETTSGHYQRGVE